MKRILSGLLALLLLLGLAGCVAVQDSRQTVDLPIVTQQAGGESLGVSTEPAPVQSSPEPAPAESRETPETVAPETEAPAPETLPAPSAAPEPGVTEDGVYDSKEEVALYIHLYGHLPSNYITKKQAEALGWPGGSLEPYAPGKCIGGSYFGNYEGLLPDARGRKWTECDIDTLGARSRGAKRIIFSNDGLIYYTDDHYESFTQLYDGWED